MEYDNEHRTATLETSLHVMENSSASLSEKVVISVKVLSKEDQEYISSKIIAALKDLQLKSKTNT
jgi:hypothetical protein